MRAMPLTLSSPSRWCSMCVVAACQIARWVPGVDERWPVGMRKSSVGARRRHAPCDDPYCAPPPARGSLRRRCGVARAGARRVHASRRRRSGRRSARPSTAPTRSCMPAIPRPLPPPTPRRPGPLTTSITRSGPTTLEGDRDRHRPRVAADVGQRLLEDPDGRQRQRRAGGRTCSRAGRSVTGRPERSAIRARSSVRRRGRAEPRRGRARSSPATWATAAPARRARMRSSGA